MCFHQQIEIVFRLPETPFITEDDIDTGKPPVEQTFLSVGIWQTGMSAPLGKILPPLFIGDAIPRSR
jgi:hypothetical protein